MNRLFVTLFLFTIISLQASLPITRQSIQKAIEQIDRFVIDGREETSVPGVAIAVVYNDEMLHLKGYGVREVGKMDSVDNDTVFQLASLSKPITSSVLAAVVAGGQVRWDSQIATLDPAFQLSDPWVTQHVTVADFLSHRSGLFDHAGDLLEDLGYDAKTIIHQLRFIPRLNPFRASYAYTNFGFSEAAFAVANSLNQSWASLASEKLFVPLRMRNASFSYKDYQNAVNKAVAHQFIDKSPMPLHVRDPDPQAPAGGANMSIKDLAKWMIFSLNSGSYKGHRLVPEKALLETQSPHIVSELDLLKNRISFYGLGWGIKYNEYGNKVLSHSGAFALGVRSQVVLIPELNVGIAVLTNAYPHALPEAITQTFLDLIYTGKVQKDWLPEMNERFINAMGDESHEYQKPKNYIPHIELDRYVGLYYNEYYGDMRIVNEFDQLVLIIGPKSFRFPLRHYNKDTFIMKTEGENSVNETKVVFEFSTDGLPKRTIVDYLNNHGLGVFFPIREDRVSLSRRLRDRQ